MCFDYYCNIVKISNEKRKEANEKYIEDIMVLALTFLSIQNIFVAETLIIKT